MIPILKSSVLFFREKPAATTKEVIAWWEARRPMYNLVVGSAGLLSCMVIAIDVAATAYMRRSEVAGPDPPIFVVFAALAYGIAANICYTCGWLTELVTRKISPGESERLAIVSFKFGLGFSVLLTLVPGFIFGAFGLLQAWPYIFGHSQR